VCRGSGVTRPSGSTKAGGLEDINPPFSGEPGSVGDQFNDSPRQKGEVKKSTINRAGLGSVHSGCRGQTGKKKS